MTEPTHTPIWDAPGPTDNYQCWSTYLELAGGRGPSIGLSVEKDATEYPDEPYRFDATACEFFFVQGGRPTLMEAQRVVRGAVIVHLEALLAQARALEPQHAEPQVRPPEPEPPPPPDPDTVGQMYVIKALRYLAPVRPRLGPVGPPERDTEKTAMWMAISELLRDVAVLGSRVHDMEQEMHERFQP